MLLQMLTVSFFVPPLSRLDTMKITHCPERVTELTDFHVHSVTQPVRIDSMLLVSFQASNNEHNYHIHMYSNSSTYNHIIVNENDKPLVHARMRLVPFTTERSRIVCCCDAEPHVARPLQSVLDKIAKDPAKTSSLIRNTPAHTDNMLTLWRFLVYSKELKTI